VTRCNNSAIKSNIKHSFNINYSNPAAFSSNTSQIKHILPSGNFGQAAIDFDLVSNCNRKKHHVAVKTQQKNPNKLTQSHPLRKVTVCILDTMYSHKVLTIAVKVHCTRLELQNARRDEILL